MQSKDRKGPIIGPGHGDREWLAGFLAAPSGDAYWGQTKLGKADEAMPVVELKPAETEALVEMLYAESGAADAKPGAREAAKDAIREMRGLSRARRGRRGRVGA